MIKDCTICEAYKDNKAGLLCPDHQEEKYLNNYRKIIDWMYKKKTTEKQSFHNMLALYMFLGWANKTLKSLLIK